MATRTTPLSAAAKLRRTNKTAIALRKAGQATRTQAMRNAEAALRRDLGEDDQTEEGTTP